MSFNITPVASGYQDIHPYSAMNIDSVKINTSLIMMKEWCLLLPMAPERDIVTSRFCKHCSQLQECKPCYYLHQHCSALEMRLCPNPLSFWIWCFYLFPHPTIYMASSRQWTTPDIAPVKSCHRWCLLLMVLVSLNPKIFRIRCCHLFPLILQLQTQHLPSEPLHCSSIHLALCNILSSVMPPHWYTHWCLKILKPFESYAAKYFLLQLSTSEPLHLQCSAVQCRRHTSFLF